MEPPQHLSTEYLEAYSGQRLIIVASVLIPILTFSVSVRIYSRHLAKARLGLDDLFALLSLGLQIAYSALTICFVEYAGAGRHFAALEELQPSVITMHYKYLIAVSFLYFVCVAIPKLAVLALYLKLFPLKPYTTMVYVVAGIVAATGIVCPIMCLNICHPFEYNWNRTIPGGSCVDSHAFYRWSSLPNILTDMAMLVLPLPIVWRLNMSTKLKIGLTVAFATGSLGLATSIVRFSLFFRVSVIGDGTWKSVGLMIWTLVEPGVYLIASCLPTFRPAFIHIFRSTRLVTSTGYKSRNANKGAQFPKPGLPGRKLNSARFHHFNNGRYSVDTALSRDGWSIEDVRGKPGISVPCNLAAVNFHIRNDYDPRITNV